MPKKKRIRYEKIDEQWVEDRAEADRVKNVIIKAATAKKLVIGIEPSGKGFKVTVEAVVEEDE